jgi:hypothetical protein
MEWEMSRRRNDQSFTRVEFRRAIRACEESGLQRYTVQCGPYVITVDKTTKPAPATEANEWDQLSKNDAA